MRQNEKGEWIYDDGTLISEHPTEDEILTHYEEYRQLCNLEQRETLEQLRDAKILAFFKEASRGKTADEAIDMAVLWWEQQYPWEVQPFVNDMVLLRQTLYNSNGYSNDKDKSLLLMGRMPARIKSLLMTFDPNFFERDKHGQSKNLKRFYDRFKIGKVRQ